MKLPHINDVIFHSIIKDNWNRFDLPTWLAQAHYPSRDTYFNFRCNNACQFLAMCLKFNVFEVGVYAISVYDVYHTIVDR